MKSQETVNLTVFPILGKIEFEDSAGPSVINPRITCDNCGDDFPDMSSLEDHKKATYAEAELGN